jgi:hypothetical protein
MSSSRPTAGKVDFSGSAINGDEDQVISGQPFTVEAIPALITAVGQVGGTLDVHDDIVAGLAVPKDVPQSDVVAAVMRYAASFPIDTWWLASAEAPEVHS